MLDRINIRPLLAWLAQLVREPAVRCRNEQYKEKIDGKDLVRVPSCMYVLSVVRHHQTTAVSPPPPPPPTQRATTTNKDKT